MHSSDRMNRQLCFSFLFMFKSFFLRYIIIHNSDKREAPPELRILHFAFCIVHS